MVLELFSAPDLSHAERRSSHTKLAHNKNFSIIQSVRFQI